MCRPHQRPHVVRPATDVVHVADQHERHVVALPQRTQGILAFQDGVGESVEPRLRDHRVLIRGKRALLDQQPVLAGPGAVERDHHQMQVHRQRVHHHHFVGQGTDEPRGRRGQQLVITDPGIARGEVAVDGEALPVFHLLQHVLARTPRLQTERMPREVERS